MKSIKIPSTQLYTLFEKKNTLHNSIKIISDLIVNVKEFNTMNKKVNKAIYNNVKNGKFKMCLINDLQYKSHTFDKIKQSNYKLVSCFFENNCENEYINYLETNWMINELLKEKWNVYYDQKMIQIYGTGTSYKKVYNHIYITPYELKKHKIISQSNIIPYNGIPILRYLNYEYEKLNKEYDILKDDKIRELL